MHKSRRLKITDINPHLTCVLCSGYLIDATTIIECLHSFCRSCIVKYLESNKYCPICDVQVHKTKPLLNIRSDQTLQDIVYKLVPGLYQNEMCRRRDFYSKHPEHKPSSAEESGEVTQFSHIYTADESISLSLEYYNNNISYDNDNNSSANTKMQAHPSRRFLRCPAAVSVSHLQKLIRAKYGLSTEHRVDILYMNDRLKEDFTLMDIAYIYLWRRKGPLHLTYRIFEVMKNVKSNENQDMKHKDINDFDLSGNHEWKEVQLQISENGIMSVTNIGETKPPETLTSNIVEVKPDINILKTETNNKLPPVPKVEESTDATATSDVKLPDPVVKKETVEENTTEKDVKLGKHKLQDANDTSVISPKIMKPNIPAVTAAKITPIPLKNVQQLSRNHPLKIHSQSVTKNQVNVTVSTSSVKLVQQVRAQAAVTLSNQVQCLNKQSAVNNNNTTRPVTQSEVPFAPTTVQTTSPSVQTTPKLMPPKTTTVLNAAQYMEKSTTKSLQNCGSPVPILTISTAAATTVTTLEFSATMEKSNFCNMSMPNIPKYTQAGHFSDNTTTCTKSANLLVHSPAPKPQLAIPCPVPNNCIQSTKVSIVSKKSPVKVGTSVGYRTLRDPPKVWNPQISRQNLTKTNVYNLNNGASTSDLNKLDNRTPAKPAKFFKVRNNMPRYLGNPASGVKPLYQVRDGTKSPPDSKKTPEVKKLIEYKNNNNNKDEEKSKQEVETKAKPDNKKQQSIIKIDPKTLKPITDKPQQNTSCTTDISEMKINQSTVPIFNPLRTQKSQTSPKIDRRSPKTSTYSDTQNPPKSPMDRSSPKTNCSKPLNSPSAKKDKLSLNFTPPNPFIPNLTSPNLAPNQFLYSNFASYDPRVMNNLYHPFSMFYSQPRLNYPGLTSPNLTLSPNLMSSLNLEGNKNLRKNYDIPALLQLSPTLDNKKPATCVKSPRENHTEEKLNSTVSERNFESTPTVKNNLNKNTKQDKVMTTQSTDVVETSNNKEEKGLKTSQESTEKSNNSNKTDSNSKCTVDKNETASTSTSAPPVTKTTENEKKKENVEETADKKERKDECKDEPVKESIEKEKQDEKKVNNAGNSTDTVKAT